MNNSSLTDRKLAYLVFRLILGIDTLIHGVVRILPPGVNAFATGTTKAFAGTVLPFGFVHAFLVAVPFIETILGALILLGLFLRPALVAGALLIGIFVFGTSLRSDWPTVSIQMIHAIVYYLLLANRADDCFSLDNWRLRTG